MSHSPKAFDARTSKVFTTGQAAKVCTVSQQTIIRCFDNGSLKGFRVPGSRFRRIPRENLYKFMKDNGIPTTALESGYQVILLIEDSDLIAMLRTLFKDDGRFAALDIRDTEIGLAMGLVEKPPHVVLVDTKLLTTPKLVLQHLAKHEKLARVHALLLNPPASLEADPALNGRVVLARQAMDARGMFESILDMLGLTPTEEPDGKRR